MSHTKEPWFVSSGREGQTVAEIVVGNGSPLRIRAHAEEEGNAADDARRIVACVNACAGIPTDDLEQCPNGGLFFLTDLTNEVVKQRDEMLAALEGLHKVCEIALAGKYGEQHTYFETRSCHFVEAATAMRAAEAAIASAKSTNSEQSLDMVTSAPAIVFYPAGSLGEYIESEGSTA